MESNRFTDILPAHRDLRYGAVRFRLGHLIARGGYSSVFKGEDSWGNQLAVKVYNEKGFKLMWQSEVANYQNLIHPHIVFMHGAFELEGQFHIALANGGTALGRISLSDPRERRVVTLIAAKGILEALHFMHKNDFVHTDINPFNVLLELSPDNKPVSVRLCDLGLSIKRVALTPGKHKAKWNPSPESIVDSGFGPEAPAMDVYSAALVLMQTLSGQELERHSDEEICRGRLREIALDLVSVEPLAGPLAEALHLNASQRPTPLDLWRKLRRIGLNSAG